MKSVKVSIILPVYNSEKFLKETLEALTKQTLKEIEIIIIDDGSEDSSEKICKEYKDNDHRVIYKKIQNSGPSVARNTGLSIAQGEFVGFCDSDDLPNLNMYETLYNAAYNNNVQISMCDIYSERTKCNLGLPFSDNKILNKDEIISDLIPKMIGNEKDDDSDITIWGSVVRCLFRKNIISESNARFPVDIEFAEDLIFTLSILAKADSVYIVNQPLYYYRLNDNSLMMSHQNHVENMFKKRKLLSNYIKKIFSYSESGICYENNRLVSFRSYVRECIGNACRKSENRNALDSIREIQTILNDKDVVAAFKHTKSHRIKTIILYTAIKKKNYILLFIYYHLRFLKKSNI